MSQARSNVYKLRDIVNVKDPAYGAKGDGTTDDTATIQAAATAAAGQILYFPEGTYKIATTTINLSSNTEIVFDPGAVIQTATTSISIFTVASKTRVRIRGGKFKYTAGGATGTIGAIELNTSSHCVVEDCDIEGAQPAGGNWQRGDEWIIDLPSAATADGGRCTAAGSPGTWKSRAALAA